MTEKNEDVKLLNCPFCGGSVSFGTVRLSSPSPIRNKNGTPRTESYFVNCQHCQANNNGIVHGYSTEGEAADAWNNRADSELSALRAERDRLAEMVGKEWKIVERDGLPTESAKYFVYIPSRVQKVGFCDFDAESKRWKLIAGEQSDIEQWFAIPKIPLPKPFALESEKQEAWMRKFKDTKNLLSDEEKELLTEFIKYLNEEKDSHEDYDPLPNNPRYQKILIENFGRWLR
jgi:hypothetical protein